MGLVTAEEALLVEGEELPGEPAEDGAPDVALPREEVPGWLDSPPWDDVLPGILDRALCEEALPGVLKGAELPPEAEVEDPEGILDVGREELPGAIED